MTKLKRLPLHDFHVDKNAKFASFGGWEMPLSYGSSLDEHNGTRKEVGVFDVSHMGQIQVKGQESSEFLDFILTNNLFKCKVGCALYSPMCNEDGGTIDDLIVYRKDSEDFLLCVNASNLNKDLEHLQFHASKYSCQLLDHSKNIGLIAIQGPRSTELIQKLFSQDTLCMKKMAFEEIEFCKESVLVARTGYTGEDGYEIYISIKNLSSLVKLLESLLEEYEGGWVGLAARDSLRLEAGFPLYGNELSDSISPISANLAWSVCFDGGDFLGKEALIEERSKRDLERVIHYVVKDRRIPRKGCRILYDETDIGEVLSGGFSPLLKAPIGSALIQGSKDITLVKHSLYAELRGSLLPIELGPPVLKDERFNPYRKNPQL